MWRANKLRIFDGEVSYIDFPEPIGFIGNNYQRFYIHYTSVIKDTANAYRYIVEGKTRVMNNICSFHGTITITKATIYPVKYYGKYKQGGVICEVDLNEDGTQSGSGFIRGKLTTDCFLDKQKLIHYDSIDSEADGFCNNQCEATWTSYKTHITKKCNWGDFRIPNCGDLDIGAGEFSVSDKYVKYGWQSYEQAFLQGPNYKVALVEENRKWWL